MQTPHSRSAVGLAAAGLLLVAAGCQYQWGPVTHPQIRSLAVGTFANDTRESSATAALRGRLAEMVSTEPGLKLAQPDTADAIVEGRIVKITQKQLARAEVRRERDREDDSDAYQTVLYRMDVTVEYQVRIPGYDRPFVQRREVVGQADLGRWPDQQVYRANALGLALGDAASQIVASVSEAW
jgi:hypothetical protein